MCIRDRHKRDTSTNQSDYLPTSPDATLLNRGCYNLLRHTEKIDPWRGGLSATYTTSGFYTWTCPVGVTSVSVVCVGGGGGGSSPSFSNGSGDNTNNLMKKIQKVILQS